MEPGRVHHGVDLEQARLLPAELGRPAACGRLQFLDRRRKRDHAAAILEIALERQHEGMAVDDAGFG